MSRTPYPVMPLDLRSPGQITLTHQDDWRAALALHGEFDVATVDELRSTLAAHFDAGRRVLRVDLRGVTFLDSSTLQVLINVHHRTTAEGGSFIVGGVTERLQRLFRMTALDRILLIDNAVAVEQSA